MGAISIDIRGSFPVEVHGIKGYSALDHGHAHAVAGAIGYLTNIVLPKAIALDHKLHAAGEKPEKGFDPEAMLPEEEEKGRVE